MQWLLRHAAVLAAAVLVLCSTALHAKPFPDRPVRIVVGFTPGGPADAIARSISDRLATLWGQPVIVENLPGAAGALAASSVARSSADGHVLLLADASSFVVLPHLRSKLAFDPLRDFAAVSVVARQVPVLAIRGAAGIDAVEELLQLGRGKADGLTYGSWGVGTWSHVKMEQLAKRTGMKLVHVPYRGAAQVVTDMLGGRVDLFLAALGLFEPHEQGGAIKVLASAADTRSRFRPDLPTFSESGVAGFSASVWFGLVAPTGTPPEVASQINADIRRVQADPEYRAQFLAAQRLEPGAESPEQFRALIEKDYENWRETVRDAAVQLTD